MVTFGLDSGSSTTKQEGKNVGKKPLAEMDEENPDVYDALSRKHLSIGCSCMSPNKARMAAFIEML